VEAAHVWLSDPAHVAGFPAGTTMVGYETPQALAALEAADVVVANHYLDRPWTKRPGAFYLQTWHGTPLKHVHADTPAPRPAVWPWLQADVARWDALLTANAFSSAILPGAFGFAGEVAETGYPRNDRLLSTEADEVRARVRADLGVADGVTAVLYTPTWRDDVLDAQGRQDFSLHLDLDEFTRRLGKDHFLLLRTHFLISAELPPIDRPGVRDVSAYPDVSDLYLAADVMVTDYSSTMFDFAVTGKPLLFYTYDLAHYRDALRGFYFDFHMHAPGPLLNTSTDVVDALGDLDSVRHAYAPAYDRFREKYCHLEDGHATDRVIARYFGTDTPA
jgi:CDP-glycerol glycerophosphotransferase